MLALLKLIPLKDFVYGAIIAALIGLFIYWTVHERHIGEAKLVAAQHVEIVKREAAVKKVEGTADAQVTRIQSQLDAALLTPVHPNVVVRMCVDTGGAVADVRHDAGAPGKSDATGAPRGGVGAVDIAPATEAILARDEAVIGALQAYVHACQQAKVCAQ